MTGMPSLILMLVSLYITLALQTSIIQHSTSGLGYLFLPSLWMTAWLALWPDIRSLFAAAIMGLTLDAFTPNHVGLGMVLSVLGTALAGQFVERYQPRSAIVWGAIAATLAGWQFSIWQAAHVLASGVDGGPAWLNPAWMRVPLVTGLAAICFITCKRVLYWQWLDWKGELEHRAGTWASGR